MKKKLTNNSESTVDQNYKKIQDKYVIYNNLVGQGAIGRVFRGIDTRTNQEFAFKQFIKPIEKDELIGEFYRREVRALKQLKGKKHILQFQDQFFQNKEGYIVTQICKGGNLKNHLKNNKLSKQQAYSLMSQIIKGYLQIYQANYIHRDLKPSNILLTEQKQIKIGDFGFAIKNEDHQNNKTLKVGSVNYMAPEILKNNRYSFKSDVWALGIIFYELLQGKKPWNSEEYNKLIRIQDKFCHPKMHFAEGLQPLERNFIKRTVCISYNDRAKPQQLFHILLKSSPETIIKTKNKHVNFNINHIDTYLSLYRYYYHLSRLILSMKDINKQSLEPIYQLSAALTNQLTYQLKLMKTDPNIKTKSKYEIQKYIKQLQNKFQSLSMDFRKIELNSCLLDYCLQWLHKNVTIKSCFGIFLVYDYLVTFKWIFQVLEKEGIKYLVKNISLDDIVESLVKNIRQSENSEDKIKIEHLGLLEQKLRQLKILS